MMFETNDTNASWLSSVDNDFQPEVVGSRYRQRSLCHIFPPKHLRQKAVEKLERTFRSGVKCTGFNIATEMAPSLMT